MSPLESTGKLLGFVRTLIFNTEYDKPVMYELCSQLRGAATNRESLSQVSPEMLKKNLSSSFLLKYIYKHSIKGLPYLIRQLTTNRAKRDFTQTCNNVLQCFPIQPYTELTSSYSTQIYNSNMFNKQKTVSNIQVINTKCR